MSRISAAGSEAYSWPALGSFSLFSGLAAAFMLSRAAIAQSPAATTGQACGQEIRSLCPWRFTPDTISSCVEENRADLSVTCQAFWDTANQCQAEMRVVCGGLNPFTIRACIAGRRNQFSQSCRAIFAHQ